MWRRCRLLLGSTNRYTDGSGRRLDTSEIPTDLYIQPISNKAYPVQGEHWQPVVAGEPSPHKGNVIVSGAGVVGLTVAALFALRGWHTTVVERCASALGLMEGMLEGHAESARPCWGPFAGLQHALVTRRAMDVFEAAGLRTHAVLQCGTPVKGVLDHPGAYNSWLTRGLVERHPFAVKMLSADLLALQKVMEVHVHSLPTGSCRVFHEHVVRAVYPLKQQLVVKPIEECGAYARMQWCASTGNGGSRGNLSSAVAPVPLQDVPPETSLTLHSTKWERKFANDAVNYDLLVCAEGVNSHLRDLIDVEGFAADSDFAIRWLRVYSEQLDHEHVHRWLHRRTSSAGRSEVRSPHQVPIAVAFPTKKNKEDEGTNGFALMVYAPFQELERLSDSEVLHTFCPDIAKVKDACRIGTTTRAVVPYPTIYCENLHNTVGLPSAVVIGDAAHTCNPFWLQGLALGLEDGVNLLNQVDAYSRHFYDAIKQYSQERGCSGDALRLITDRCLYYERMKHINPLVRFQNYYQHLMNVFLPRMMNEYHTGASVNHLYSKSLELMLNGRGYTSYEFAEKQQAKHCAFYHIGKVYT
ncbi:hypothetical protein ERJ75_001019600 [Trypanosoma vivax]|uniref:Putative flavoprotein monooxygenase n=1 Tax=Trypanosoma vivax (strain Y486) TaxID=1055687 RepID=G0U2C9_TRYVY|nr:putative flavoprotein monooxygenase [Trypanosoma vivax]KAH8611269.1 hypothetical protein ERJ75_001019600 [Trypanosoma vivax]CCC50432.1 putative flavoprotein monooxygenase [Trypanosoma vivax Y486]